MKKTILLSGLLFITISCVGRFGFAVKEEIMPNYYLIAADDIDELGLAYHEDADGDVYETLIDATVIAVGFNDKYIIAKQDPINNKTINYYIIPIKKGMDGKTKNSIYGPLSLDQFDSKRKELNISNITFSKK